MPTIKQRLLQLEQNASRKQNPIPALVLMLSENPTAEELVKHEIKARQAKTEGRPVFTIQAKDARLK